MKSIRVRLTLFLLAGAFLFLGTGGALVYLLIRSYFYREFDERLRVQALSITSVIKQEKEHIDFDFSDRYLREFDDEFPEKFYQVWSPLPVDNSDEPKIRRSDSLEDHQNLPRQTGTLKEPVYWNFTLPDGRPGRAIGIRYTPHADRHDRRRNFDPDLKIDLVVAENRSNLVEALTTILHSLLLVGGLGLAAALVTIPLVLKRGLRPLRFVGSQAQSISIESLHLRFPEERMPQELKPICNRLNELLARLQKSFERERQFSSDIAHELRTPIAELRSYAELNLKWPQQPAAKFPSNALKIALQMESLVENLLLLSRCDQERLSVSTDQVDLAASIANAIKAFSSKARERNVEIHKHLPEGFTVTTDRTLMRSILNNLIGNAVEYAPEGGGIRIEGNAGEDRFRLSISNAAPHLDSNQVQNLFDRFWRSDMARSSNEHFGLGLPLSRALAEQLGLKLEARLEDGDLILTLSGPLKPQALVRTELIEPPKQ